ncbi:MAG: sodium:proline symporter [Halarchaeum sp.]
MTPLTAIGATLAAMLATTTVGVRYVRARSLSLDAHLTARGRASEGVTAASVVASSMGVWILLSPAEAGAAYGGLPAVLGYALGSALPLLLFVPVARRVRELMPNGRSLTEYVRARYGRTFHAFVLAVSVFYMLVFLAAGMTGVTLALSVLAGVPPWATAAVVGGCVLAYTTYGGLVASLVTDTAQTLLVFPLLVVGFAGALWALGGTGAVYGAAAATTPALLSATNPAGVRFGVYVALAVLGANVLHQGMWQRVWAAESTRAAQRAFAASAVVVVPMVLLAGLFGVVAASRGLVDGTPAVSFFLVADAALPDVLVVAVAVLAVLLVASTADTILNAVASVATTAIERALDDPDERTLTVVARAFTAVVAVVAIVVGARGYDVLALFLLADLLGAATFAPFVLGLYLPTLTERGAFAANLLALACGLAFFPTTHSALEALGLPLPAPSFLWAFVAATGVSVAVSLLAARVSTRRFDFDRLDRRVAADGGERR